MDRHRQEIRAINSPFFKKMETVFFQNWWVMIFALACFIAYEQGAALYQEQTVYLSKRLEALKQKQQNLDIEQKNLRLQINSQSDPSWIELTLMKVLGVVPEGQKKVYFQKQTIE